MLQKEIEVLYPREGIPSKRLQKQTHRGPPPERDYEVFYRPDKSRRRSGDHARLYLAEAIQEPTMTRQGKSGEIIGPLVHLLDKWYFRVNQTIPFEHTMKFKRDAFRV